jgi:hypothetical protein
LMQQRQLRLGDILDDYCPRERRLTNHVVVAMIGLDVKQTRCSTCETEHEYKQAKLPRLRRKADGFAALAAQAPGGAPKRPEPAVPIAGRPADDAVSAPAVLAAAAVEPPAGGSPVLPARFDKHDDARPSQAADAPENPSAEEDDDADRNDEGPVPRPLIRASLPRVEGAPPPTRPATDFTIRQPAGRQNRFRPRHTGGGQQPQGNRSGGHMGGGMPRHGGGGHPASNRMANRHGQGRKRSK